MDKKGIPPVIMSTVYSTMGKYRIEGKYCDVNIDIGNESFKGHRVLLASLSEYFDTIFSIAISKGDKFLTEEEQSVTLGDIEPAALKNILESFYTGRVHVTDSNVFSLLFAGEFLKLRNSFVEEQCVEYLQKRVRETSEPLPNALDIFEFGFTERKYALISLLSEHIYEHLEYFSKHDEKFVELSFNQFTILLKRKNSTSMNDENVLLNAIIMWAHHSFAERMFQVDELMECVDFTKISGSKLSLEKNRENSTIDDDSLHDCAEDDIAEHHSTQDYSAPNYSTTDDRRVLLSKTNDVALHVFLRYSTVLGRVGVLSTRKSTNDWTLSHEFDSIAEQMRSIALDGNLYSLSYEYRLPHGHQTFSVSNAIKAHPMLPLKNPPIMLRKFDMCGMRKNIYVYDQDLSEYSNLALRDDKFSAEEISRGIYVYKSDANQWLPLPAMEQRVYRSCITASSDCLYVVGGLTHSGNPTKFAQFYDTRAKRWEKLPEMRRKYDVEDCCAHEGKIYLVSTDSKNTSILDVYEPMAGKWRSVSKLERMGVQLVSYKDELWIMNRFDSDLNFLTYNEMNCPKLREVKSLSEAVAKASDNAYCLDTVVF